MTSDCPGTTAPTSMPFRVTMASTNARGSAPSAAASAIDQTVRRAERRPPAPTAEPAAPSCSTSARDARAPRRPERTEPSPRPRSRARRRSAATANTCSTHGSIVAEHVFGVKGSDSNICLLPLPAGASSVAFDLVRRLMTMSDITPSTATGPGRHRGRQSAPADTHPRCERSARPSGLTSSSSVHAQLANLERKGLLTKDATKPRAMSLSRDSLRIVGCTSCSSGAWPSTRTPSRRCTVAGSGPTGSSTRTRTG